MTFSDQIEAKKQQRVNDRANAFNAKYQKTTENVDVVESKKVNIVERFFIFIICANDYFNSQFCVVLSTSEDTVKEDFFEICILPFFFRREKKKKIVISIGSLVHNIHSHRKTSNTITNITNTLNSQPTTKW